MSMKEFVNILQKMFDYFLKDKNFMLRSQNDSSEFITKLLQIIKLEKNHDLSFMDGELETRISCTNCGDIDQYVSPFIGQKVCVPYSQPLNSLLESFFLVSEPCSQCSGTFSTSQFFKGTIPHWLLFQFYYTEASTRVELDENELVCSLSVKEGECAEYDIKAMTLRCGGDLKYGHYVSAVFFNKGVRVYNDSFIRDYPNFKSFWMEYSGWQIKDILLESIVYEDVVAEETEQQTKKGFLRRVRGFVQKIKKQTKFKKKETIGLKKALIQYRKQFIEEIEKRNSHFETDTCFLLLLYQIWELIIRYLELLFKLAAGVEVRLWQSTSIFSPKYFTDSQIYFADIEFHFQDNQPQNIRKPVEEEIKSLEFVYHL